jgi:hypothetical protein
MSTQPPGHGNISPELRQMAQLMLERLDPVIRTAAALAAARTSDTPGRCQQVWCPVCAVGALVIGEEHSLLAVVAEHSVSLLTMLRALLDDADSGDGPPEGDGASATDSDGPRTNGRYQHIPITIED